MYQKCSEILQKTESQKTEQEKDYIKNILKQTYLFKQLQEEINFQLQEKERESNGQGSIYDNINSNILDIDVLLNRSQRNVKYLRIPKNEFVFHKGDAGDRLYIIIKGHAGVYTERDKQLINDELAKEKTLTKQIQILTNKILHYEHQLTLKENKLKEDIQFSQQQEQDNLNNNENDNNVKAILKVQRQKDEVEIVQIQNTLNELRLELDNQQKELKQLINPDQEIIKNACGEDKELIGKYFTPQSTSGNICYFTKLKTLNAFNHLGEASIITNENRTATVMACSPPINNDNGETQQSSMCEIQQNISNQQNSSQDQENEDLHFLYLEANVFVGLFSATLDQINYPLTVLSKILTQTSKDLIVRLSYLFKKNEYTFNTHIFSEGIDNANYIYLVKKGSVQIQRQARDELDTNDPNQIIDDAENLKMKNRKTTMSRQQVVIAVIGEGQFFGLEDIIFKKRSKYDESDDEILKFAEKKIKRTCSAITLSSCLIYQVHKSVFLTSGYQFYEIQNRFFEYSKAKQLFYKKQTEKNNQIKNYLENEINRINEQPEIEKTLIQMSINHNKQMLKDTNKISNMLGSYIKGNRDALQHQKEILQLSHVRNTSQTARETQAESNNTEMKSDYSDPRQSSTKNNQTTTSPQKNEYGRIKLIPNRNSADIVYALMVQAENEKVLNVKEKPMLSVMPQSQENVKQILRAQRFYSKSKDAHNKNIRDPSRQNMNETIFTSQSTTNLNSMLQFNNTDKPQSRQGQKLLHSAMSLSEFDDTTTNSHFRLERKNNIIQVKKMKSIGSSLQNTPLTAPVQQNSNNTPQLELSDQQPADFQSKPFKRSKYQHSLTSFKSIEFDPKQFQPINSNKYASAENNIFYSSSSLSDRQQIDKLLNNRKESDNVSLTNNSIAERSEFFESDLNFYSTNKNQNMTQDKAIMQDQTQESQKLSTSQLSFKNTQPSSSNRYPFIQNSEKKLNSLHFSQPKLFQNFTGQGKVVEFAQTQKVLSFKDKPEFYSEQKASHKIRNKDSVDINDSEDKNKFYSPILNPQSTPPKNIVSIFQNPKINSSQQSESACNINKQPFRKSSQDTKQYKQYFSSLANLDAPSSTVNIQSTQEVTRKNRQKSQTYLRIEFNEKNLNKNSSQSNIKNSLQKFTPKKGLVKGKLKPLLPMLNAEKVEEPEQQQQQNINPFQARSLQPSFNRTFVPSAY